jgi:hypothetical protein
LKNAISGIVEQSLANINDGIVKRTATESLARVALQTPQQSTSVTPVYDTGGYRESYSTAPGHVDTTLASQAPGYASMAGGSTHPYNLGTSMSLPQHTSNAYSQHQQQAYSAEDPGMTTTHVAALAAASTNTPQPNEAYGYSNAPHAQTTNSGPPAYTQNGYAQQDWRQWSRTYLHPQQPLSQSGEYINTATTLMALGGREGSSQDPGHNSQGNMENTGVPGHVHWPELAFPNAANVHGHNGPQ